MTQKTITLFFESLNPNSTIDDFKTIYANSVTFKDPFNEVMGVENVSKIFAHMYQNLDNPRFVVTEYLSKNHIVYVKWDFSFNFKNDPKENSFEGVSRLVIDEENKIVSHTDYWDASEHIYEKMPLLGAVLRFIKRKLSIS